MEMGIKLG